MCRRNLFLLLAMLQTHVLFGQGYRTVVADEDRYFLSSDSLNIGLRVVETDTIPNGIIHHFYTDLRPAVFGDGSGCVVDTGCVGMGWDNGGPDIIYRPDGAGWMGEKVFVRDDGMDVYFNLNRDSIFVKTDAQLNEQWQVHGNVGDTILFATVVDIVPIQVMNSIEPCKVIELHAEFQNVPVQHAMNGQQWKLSGTNGWAEVHSLCWFPDFQLPDTQTAYDCIGFDPGHEQYTNSLLTLTKFEPLSFNEMFPISVGDVFQIRKGMNMDTAIVFRFTTYSVTDVSHYSDSVVVQFSTEWFQQWDGAIGSGTHTQRWLFPDQPFPHNATSGHDRYFDGEIQRVYQGVDPDFHVGTSENWTDIRNWFENLQAQCGDYVVRAQWESNVFLEDGCGYNYSQADFCYGPEFWFQGVPFAVYSKGCAGGYIEQIPTYVATENCQFGTLQFLSTVERSAPRIEVFPNPTQGHLNFQSSEEGNLFINDMSGRTVFTSTASKGKNTVNVRSLPDGIYLLRLQTENAASSARFIKN